MVKNMNNANQLLSFIVLTYRNFDGIYETLDSLFNQDYPQIELIISDDGSPNREEYMDDIKEYIETHRNSRIVNVIYNLLEENVGTVRNVNSALRCANGVYIKELGADDTLNGTDALSKYVAFLEESGLDICFSKLQGVTEDGQIIPSLASCIDDYTEVRKMTPTQICNQLFVRNFLPAPAWCAKKDLFEKYGYCFEEIRLIEDYPYWIHLSLSGVHFGFMDDVLINYKMSGVSSTGTYGMAFMNDMLKIYDQYIFPNDKRYGCLQKIYNQLKRMGLNTYIAKAQWDSYSVGTRIAKGITYAPFFLYIRMGEAKTAKKNKRLGE